MTKGRNAAEAFKSTRAARFADARREAAEQRAARRELLVLSVEDVQDGDEVALEAGGFGLAGEADRSLWATREGRVFTRRATGA